MGIFKEAWSAVAEACDDLASLDPDGVVDGCIQDYSLAQVAQRCGGRVAVHKGHAAIVVGDIPVQMLDNPTWVGAGNENSLFKQHYPKP